MRLIIRLESVDIPGGAGKTEGVWLQLENGVIFAEEGGAKAPSLVERLGEEGGAETGARVGCRHIHVLPRVQGESGGLFHLEGENRQTVHLVTPHVQDVISSFGCTQQLAKTVPSKKAKRFLSFESYLMYDLECAWRNGDEAGRGEYFEMAVFATQNLTCHPHIGRLEAPKSDSWSYGAHQTP